MPIRGFLVLILQAVFTSKEYISAASVNFVLDLISVQLTPNSSCRLDNDRRLLWILSGRAFSAFFVCLAFFF